MITLPNINEDYKLSACAVGKRNEPCMGRARRLYGLRNRIFGILAARLPSIYPRSKNARLPDIASCNLGNVFFFASHRVGTMCISILGSYGNNDFGIASTCREPFAFPGCVCFLFRQPLGTPTRMKQQIYNALWKSPCIPISIFGNYNRNRAITVRALRRSRVKMNEKPNSRLGSYSLRV